MFIWNHICIRLRGNFARIDPGFWLRDLEDIYFERNQGPVKSYDFSAVGARSESVNSEETPKSLFRRDLMWIWRLTFESVFQDLRAYGVF